MVGARGRRCAAPSSAGTPRTISRASRNSGTRATADGLASRPVEVEPDAAADEEDGDEEAVADGFELGAEVRVRGGVAVDEADHGAGEERAEDALQPEPFGEHDERDQQDDGEPDPDLGGGVLQAGQHPAQVASTGRRRGRRARSRPPWP